MTRHTILLLFLLVGSGGLANPTYEVLASGEHKLAEDKPPAPSQDDLAEDVPDTDAGAEATEVEVAEAEYDPAKDCLISEKPNERHLYCPKQAREGRASLSFCCGSIQARYCCTAKDWHAAARKLEQYEAQELAAVTEVTEIVTVVTDDGGDNGPGDNDDDRLPTWMVVLIIIGGILVAGVVVFCLLAVCFKLLCCSLRVLCCCCYGEGEGEEERIVLVHDHQHHHYQHHQYHHHHVQPADRYHHNTHYQATAPPPKQDLYTQQKLYPSLN